MIVAVLLAGLGAAGYYGYDYWQNRPQEVELPLMANAEIARLEVIVTERGNLESTQTVNGVCEVKGYDNKIIFIVKEGEHVEEGEVVVRLDTAKIDERVAEQEVKINQSKEKVATTVQELEIEKKKGESEIAAAELELKLAKMDLKKYEQGEYNVELADLSGQIALAASEYEEAVEFLENMRQLVKKGFKEQRQLRGAEQDLERTEYYLDRDKQKLQVLKEFDYPRKLTELEAKAEEADRKLVRARATAEAGEAKAKNAHQSAISGLEIDERRLKELKEQLDKCEIKAKQAGVVAYSNEDWWSSDRRIREGATVYQRQQLFTLPDMTSMQVKVNVHESLVKKVKPGQKAEIRVESFPDVEMTGTVTSVAQLADSSYSWMRGGVKEYTTIVKIDDIPGVDLKPGMTAEARILVNQLDDVLVVPVQAVTEHERQHYVYTYDDPDFTRRAVEIGDSNQKFVQIVSGVDNGAQVALDARARGIADFDDVPDSVKEFEKEDQAESTSTPAQTTGG